MERRTFLARLVAPGLALVTLPLCGALTPSLAADTVCPHCGAPLEPGAAFCGSCGSKLEGAAAPAPAGGSDRPNAVVQVVTIHDNELTSTLGSLAYESNVRIDSILG